MRLKIGDAIHALRAVRITDPAERQKLMGGRDAGSGYAMFRLEQR